MRNASPGKASFAIFILGLITVVGCGQKGPPRAPVVGIIRYEGKPVIGAAVTFVPTEAKLRVATAVTDNVGRYSLETLGFGDGAILGKHQVCVVLRAEAPPPKDFFSPRIVGKPLLPQKYFSPEKSGLTAEVADVAENRFDFELTGPVQ